ncbi:nuclease PA3 [Teratosphaeria destructans]|uniref:Nuclease PA3 n=1 Tax=Teratosphaeria destructans TaxID=418781 RepID=A0A9W7VZZ8_9PEZI|nr:nuclease PA3 [Teratosphaeria destructans]
MSFTTAIILLGAFGGTVQAWGSLGHETVAYIAQNYVKGSTASWAQGILGDTSDSYLANVATWADSYRYTTDGKFSAPYHFIDAEDNPPSSCSVDYDRDCGSTGCSVSAIANYTTRVQSSSLSDAQVEQALKFLVHFLGDITQPLHDEALEYGGNDIDVTFDGTSTNLHHTWDTNMPEELVGGYTLSDAQDWANNLAAQIDSGAYSSQKNTWVSGLDITDATASAMTWASDANQYVCSVVIPNGQTAYDDQELYPDYYNGAIGTIELQIAKGGYRLAKWLDAIADAAGEGSSKVKRGAGEVDLSGRSLLPAPSGLSPAKLRRLAVGWGCRHEH